MDQIITFNKTFQDRLNEYKLVFGDTKLPPIIELKNQWSIYLELELELTGWQAFWNIPRTICHKQNIAHPTIVLVQVNEVDYNELAAFVDIIAVQGDHDDDTHLDCVEYSASLLHLWPTKQQTDAVDAVVVANTLDKLRFFYNNVVMPWDYLDTKKSDGNLEERLQLHFNIKENIYAKNKTVRIRTLQKQIQNEFEHIDRVNLQNLDPNSIELNTKIIELKLEYDLLQILPMEQKSNDSNSNWLIFPNKCSLKNHMDYLESIKCLAEKNDKYQTAVSLESALEVAIAHDVIFINEGTHLINSAGILKDGAVLRSVSNDPHKTLIETTKENALIEFMGDQLLIENVHLNVTNARCAIITHCGQITLKNCVISGHPAAEHAIIALPDAKITLDNCKMSGFNVGLYASANSVVNLINCNVFDVSNALKLFDDSKVCLLNCIFGNVSRCCIYFETKNEECRTGDETILKANPYITINDCKFENNPTIVVIGNKEDIFNTNI